MAPIRRQGDILDEGYDMPVYCGGPLRHPRIIARSGSDVCTSPAYVAEYGEPAVRAGPPWGLTA